MKKFLFCIAESLTPKMRRSLKLEVNSKELDDVKTACREKGLAFDIIPITTINLGRIAVVLNQVKSEKRLAAARFNPNVINIKEIL